MCILDVNEIQLNTEKRIEERVQWEKWRNEKEQEKHELETQRQRQKEQEERENEKQLRRQMEPKAKPIRKYKEVAIKSSDKPLTQPHSPMFATDRTLRRSMRCWVLNKRLMEKGCVWGGGGMGWVVILKKLICGIGKWLLDLQRCLWHFALV